ncbi:MAG: autotransporter outer membrane beta-barrel domain-containing protein [Brevundimonas sp.]|uniref:autotransporter outer membrane beta-barrel domain-containing protein n=1 Tax=Brevundimonas sp. TaxID=1871086 RepID=UPI00403488E1
MLARYALAFTAAPLLVAAGAQAQVVVSTTRTSPILTSNAAGSEAADIRITEDGAIELTSGTAITGDSDNDITLEEGSYIQIDEAEDGATGVLLRGGQTGDLSIDGAISITDDQDGNEDDDEDGDTDGPYAVGRDRYGVRVTGDGARIGDIKIEDAGSVYVEGNASSGLSLETDLIGNIDLLGAVSVVGDDTFGVRLTGNVNGRVLLSGSSVSANGENAVGVSVEGDVSGRLQIQSSISTNGFRYTTAPTSLSDLTEEEREEVDLADDTLYLEDLDADDLLRSGSALVVAGDVAGGILLGSTPGYAAGGGDDDDADRDGVEDGQEDDDGDGVINEDDDDLDGDGILDENEDTASLTTYGGAPALVIGSQTSDVRIGAVGTGDDAYGLINEGSIAAVGVYDDIDVTGLQIGVSGGGRVVVAGGVRNDGAISASASEGSSTALAIGAGASVPALVNTGTVQAVTTSEGRDRATALQIDEGGSLTSMTNSGVIASVVYGEAGDAIAVLDRSGQLSTIENSGSIYGTLSATDNINDTDDDNEDAADEVTTGRQIALDLSANVTGVRLIQTASSNQRLTDSDGDDVFDDEDPDDDDDGVPDAEDDDDNDDDNDGVYDYEEPLISGEILLGSGADLIDLRNGTIQGDVSFGDGADRLAISGTAAYRGVISDSDGRLDIAVENGTLDARQASATTVSSLSVGDGGQLIVSIDPATRTSGGFAVTGAASFADKASLGVRLTSLIQESARFSIVTANSLDYGDVSGRLAEETAPYLVVASFSVDRDLNAVNVDVRRRTAAEIGFSGVETAAYDAFYAALDRDDDVLDAFLATETRADFINLYEQTLPDHSGGTLQSLANGVDAVTRALAGRNAVLAPGEVSGWAQEINFYADKDRTETYGFRADGFGVAGGYETMTSGGVVGASFAVTSSDLEDPESEAEEVLSATLVELGLYWRAQGRGWSTWARAAAGYATFSSVRTLVDDSINIQNEADWDGFTLSAAAGASYERRFGRFSVRPEVYAEVFALTESDRVETGGGDSFDLEIDGRDGSLANAVAVLNLGYGFGEDGWLRPELRLGWKQTLAYDAGETVARYASGGSSFSLTSDAVTGGGPTLGFGLTIGNTMGRLMVSGDAQLLEDMVRYSLLLRASFRF